MFKKRLRAFALFTICMSSLTLVYEPVYVNITLRQSYFSAFYLHRIRCACCLTLLITSMEVTLRTGRNIKFLYSEFHEVNINLLYLLWTVGTFNGVEWHRFHLYDLHKPLSIYRWV